MNHNYSSCFSEYIQGMLAARAVLGYAEEPYAAPFPMTQSGLL